jgi:flagellar export protein FliJ
VAQFLFHLDGLLRHRKNQERQRQRDLAVIAAEMTLLEEQLGALNGTVSTTLDDLRTNRLVGKIDVQFLAAHRRYILSVQRKTASIAQKMAVVQKRIDEVRLGLMEAARHRKMLEKLREKHHQAWMARQNHREFLEADDIGTRLALADAADVGEDAP